MNIADFGKRESSQDCPKLLTSWKGMTEHIRLLHKNVDRLCCLVVRVLGYRFGGPDSIPGTTRKKSSGSETGCAQPREYN
jgi:hypothetical protein